MQIHEKDNLKIKGVLKFTIRDAKTKEIKRVHEYHNLIPTVGRTMLADNLTNTSPDNTPRITHVALGSDATAPANGDTTLGTETYRNAIASQTNADNIAYLTGFFDATEVTGTFAEAGIFADGSGAADSGILFSHVAISITKSNTETLTVDWTITIS
jgi:hypothetical protein|tara:strand:+ start:5017 stop:5487 length:471 start_codon:yes stop_codon:yes gene_type:complete